MLRLSSLLPLLSSLPPHPSLDPRDLALSWRAGFFAEIHARHLRGDPTEDIDTTHRRVLDRVLAERGVKDSSVWDAGIRARLVAQWHVQVAWGDVIPALQKLRCDDGDTAWFLVVLANGTTRLQLDIAASSGIPFHTLLSSELLGLTKPDPAVYRKAMALVRLEPGDCVMLASHLYDLEAAKKVGMRTVYVHRDTEDVGISISSDSVNEGEYDYVDMYVDGREGKEGFAGVVNRLMNEGVTHIGETL